MNLVFVEYLNIYFLIHTYARFSIRTLLEAVVAKALITTLHVHALTISAQT